jgi:hypothetical protein
MRGEIVILLAHGDLIPVNARVINLDELEYSSCRLTDQAVGANFSLKL